MNKILIKSIYPVIKECYSQDKELLDRWHITAGTGLKNCAKDTANRVKHNDCNRFYKIEDNNELIGYFGSAIINDKYNFLATFFICPKFRQSNVVNSVFELIKDHFKREPFIVGVYDKNIPANKFLKRMGCQEINRILDNNELGIVYLYQ